MTSSKSIGTVDKQINKVLYFFLFLLVLIIVEIEKYISLDEMTKVHSDGRKISFYGQRLTE